jgi:hypothetical protein
MWKNNVEWVRPSMTIWRMRFACRITKAKRTLTIPNTYYVYTATMVARTRISVTFIRTLLFF